MSSEWTGRPAAVSATASPPLARHSVDHYGPSISPRSTPPTGPSTGCSPWPHLMTIEPVVAELGV
jgi:hypothetical protein